MKICNDCGNDVNGDYCLDCKSNNVEDKNETVLEIIIEKQNKITEEIDRRKEFKKNLDVLSGGAVDFNYLSEIEILIGQIRILETIKEEFVKRGGGDKDE